MNKIAHQGGNTVLKVFGGFAIGVFWSVLLLLFGLRASFSVSGSAQAVSNFWLYLVIILSIAILIYMVIKKQWPYLVGYVLSFLIIILLFVSNA